MPARPPAIRDKEGVQKAGWRFPLSNTAEGGNTVSRSFTYKRLRAENTEIEIKGNYDTDELKLKTDYWTLRSDRKGGVDIEQSKDMSHVGWGRVNAPPPLSDENQTSLLLQGIEGDKIWSIWDVGCMCLLWPHLWQHTIPQDIVPIISTRVHYPWARTSHVISPMNSSGLLFLSNMYLPYRGTVITTTVRISKRKKKGDIYFFFRKVTIRYPWE